MKLKKYLLPIASVASVAAVVAPIVTSCGGTSLKWEFEYNHTTGELEEYETKYQPAQSSASVTLADAKKIYFDKLAENADVLADDMLSGSFVERYWATLGYSKYSGSSKVTIKNYNKDSHVVSFVFEDSIETRDVANLTDGKWHVKLEFNNIPLDVKPVTIGVEGIDIDYFVNPVWQDEGEIEDTDVWYQRADTITEMKKYDDWSIRWFDEFKSNVVDSAVIHKAFWNSKNTSATYWTYAYEYTIDGADALACASRMMYRGSYLSLLDDGE